MPLFLPRFITASFPNLQGTNSVICTIYVQYLYNICTFTIVHILYKYCTNIVQRPELVWRKGGETLVGCRADDVGWERSCKIKKKPALWRAFLTAFYKRIKFPFLEVSDEVLALRAGFEALEAFFLDLAHAFAGEAEFHCYFVEAECVGYADAEVHTYDVALVFGE